MLIMRIYLSFSNLFSYKHVPYCAIIGVPPFKMIPANKDTAMQKTELLASILSHLTADVIKAEKTQCTSQWRDYGYTPDYSKIYYILKGEGRIVINGRQYFPKPGQICIMPANTVQSYEAINDNAYLKYWTHFVLNSGGRSIFDIIQVPYVLDVASSDLRSRIETIFINMTAHQDNKSFVSNIMLESYIRELVAIYLDIAGIEHVNIIQGKDNDRQSEILAYINENIDKKISIDALAKKLYLHPNYFIKYFKKSFGISPAKFINKKKTALACDMLCAEGLNISEIATQLGYSDIYHFSKVFKKYTGFSPAYYRRYIAKSG